MKSQADIYAWFVFDGIKISSEIEDAIEVDDQAIKNGDITLNVNGYIFRRMYGKPVNGSYSFSFPFVGWENECCELFLEVDFEQKELITFGNPGKFFIIEITEDPDGPIIYKAIPVDLKVLYVINNLIYRPQFTSSDSKTFFVLAPLSKP